MGKQGAQKPTCTDSANTSPMSRAGFTPRAPGQGQDRELPLWPRGGGKCAMKKHSPTGTRPQCPKDRTWSCGLCPAEGKVISAEGATRPGRPTES